MKPLDSYHMPLFNMQRLPHLLRSLLGRRLKQEKVYIFWDIDNTLLLPKGYIGTQAWWADALQAEQRTDAEGAPFSDKRYQIVLACWQGMLSELPYTYTHPLLPSVLKDIKRHFQQVTVTARDKKLTDCTLKQFNDLQITTYFKDFIFEAGSDKGKYIYAYLQKKKINPMQPFVMIDDRPEHLDEVRHWLPQTITIQHIPPRLRSHAAKN